MMSRFLFLLLLCITSAGCKEQITQEYLMTHPLQLKQEVEQCQAKHSLSAEEVNRCELIMNSARQLMPLIEAQQQDPQLFGLRVLEAQQACAKGQLNSCEQVKVMLAVVGLNTPE